MPTTLSGAASVLMPPQVVGPIFDRVTEHSAIAQRGRKVPLALNASTAVPIPGDVPIADWVAEAAAKPLDNAGVGSKTITGKKLAVLIPVSEEVFRTNPGQMYSQIVQDLPTSLARAFDYAAITGKSLRTGAAGPFSDYILQTPNTIEMGTASAATGGMYTDLWNGVSTVLGRGYDFNGFVIDPIMVPKLATSVDANGRPFFVSDLNSANVSTNANGSLIGYPSSPSRGVSGKYPRANSKVQTITVTGTPTGGTFTLNFAGNVTAPIAYNAAGATVQTAVRALGGIFSLVTVTGAGPYTLTFPDAGGAQLGNLGTNALTGGTSPSVTVVGINPDTATGSLRIIGGDWSQAVWGQAMGIELRVSKEASYFDGSVWHSAFQENLVLILAETYFGFALGDPTAFVKYTDAS